MLTQQEIKNRIKLYLKDSAQGSKNFEDNKIDTRTYVWILKSNNWMIDELIKHLK